MTDALLSHHWETDWNMSHHVTSHSNHHIVETWHVMWYNVMWYNVCWCKIEKKVYIHSFAFLISLFYTLCLVSLILLFVVLMSCHISKKQHQKLAKANQKAAAAAAWNNLGSFEHRLCLVWLRSKHVVPECMSWLRILLHPFDVGGWHDRTWDQQVRVQLLLEHVDHDTDVVHASYVPLPSAPLNSIKMGGLSPASFVARHSTSISPPFPSPQSHQHEHKYRYTHRTTAETDNTHIHQTRISNWHWASRCNRNRN